MARRISRYPDGVTGAALLLLRLSVALVAFPAVARVTAESLQGWVAASASGVLGLALAGGFGTRPAALALVAVLAAGVWAGAGEAAPYLATAAGAGGALVLLGPGAWSIDAHRFGRRVIRL